MTNQEVLEDVKGTIKWLLDNGYFKDTETAYNCAMNSLELLKEQFSLCGVVVSGTGFIGKKIEEEDKFHWKHNSNNNEKESETELFCPNCGSTHVYELKMESIKCYRCKFYGAK